MHIVSPDTRELLLPLLACLPSAFLGPRPPAAFLPLLSPILRQRVHLFTSNTRNTEQHLPPSQRSEAANWLNLLTWSPERAARLIEIVGALQLEPHPVSGELELEDSKVTYRRLDTETLQGKCDVQEHDITVIWVWCENDTGTVGLEPGEGVEAKNGWRVAEVRPFEEESQEQWYNSMILAEEAAEATMTAGSSEELGSATTATSKEAEEDDDDYWASYDRTPATRTPAPRRSPAPASAAADRQRKNSTAEADYFDRYADEVQPALDGHDPDEEEDAAGVESSFKHHEPSREDSARRESEQAQPLRRPAHDEDIPITTAATHDRIHSPSPTRPASGQSNVDHLETEASSAGFAVKNHLSMQMKSMYRLARATGIEHDEFVRLVETELAVLPMIDL